MRPIIVLLCFSVLALSVPYIPDGFSAYFTDIYGHSNYAGVDSVNELYLFSQVTSDLNLVYTLTSCGASRYSYDYSHAEGGPSCDQTCVGPSCLSACLNVMESFWNALNTSQFVGNCWDGTGQLWMKTNVYTYSYCFDGNSPRAIAIVGDGNMFNVTVKNYIPLPPDPSIFAIPSYCSN